MSSVLTKESSEELIRDEDVVGEMDFEPIEQPTNIYETEKSVIMVQTTVRQISETDKKDSAGNPILRFQSSPVVSTNQKASAGIP